MEFYYSGNPIQYVDNVKFDSINFSLKGYQSICRLQRRLRIRYKRKQMAATIIQSN